MFHQLNNYWSQLHNHKILYGSLLIIILLFFAFILHVIIRSIILHTIKLLRQQQSFYWINDLLSNKVFHRFTQIIPSLVIQFIFPLIPTLPEKLVKYCSNLALAFTVFFLILTCLALLNTLLDIYARTNYARTRSIKGYVQLAKMIVIIFGIIIIASIIIDRSPLLLLSSLGAMSAVLLLIYKDTLMSFVASVQLTSNDMLRVGDWIEMKQVGADGDVVDITLYTVKVQNFDKTIVSIPTWRLMSESFKNWRGMEQSGGRRIKRAIYIDATKVKFLTDTEEKALQKILCLSKYIETKKLELKEFNIASNNCWGFNSSSITKLRITNIGTFRAFALAYLKTHPDINKYMTCMVRQMQPTSEGIPIEIYCFTKTTSWFEYERIQGDIFDYLFAIMPEFSLRLYQKPSGQDLVKLIN